MNRLSPNDDQVRAGIRCIGEEIWRYEKRKFFALFQETRPQMIDEARTRQSQHACNIILEVRLGWRDHGVSVRLD